MRWLFLILLFVNISGYADCNNQNDTAMIYTVVEKMPEFPNGAEALRKYLDTSINHINKHDVAGAVLAHLKFVVNASGKAINPSVLKSSGDAELDKKGLDVIKKMPLWIPGVQNGKRVSTYYNVTVHFEMTKSVYTAFMLEKNNREAADKLYNEGVKFVKEGKNEEGIESFKKCLAVNSSDVDALYNLGAVYLKIGKKDSACEIWNEIRKLKRSDADDFLRSFCGMNIPKDSVEKFKVAEKMPEPVGGIKIFYKYIGDNINTPKRVRQGNVTGKCNLKFVVEADGSLSNVDVVKGVDNCPECDAEAIRVVKSCPIKWIPGVQNGKVVRVHYNMPIRFGN